VRAVVTITVTVTNAAVAVLLLGCNAGFRSWRFRLDKFDLPRQHIIVFRKPASD
jgi:hypothetical protein